MCLTTSTKIPANVGAYLDVHLGKHFAVDTELAFEPDRTQSGSGGLELEDSILCVGHDNNLKIPVLNKADVSMDLLGRVPIGTVTVLTDFEEMEDTFAQENSSMHSRSLPMLALTWMYIWGSTLQWTPNWHLNLIVLSLGVGVWN